MALAMVARNAYVATARCLVAPAFRVYGPATHVWNQLQSGRSVHEIAQLLQVQFPDYRVSAQDVSAFLADLQLAGLCPTPQWGSGRQRYRLAVRQLRRHNHSWWSPWTLRIRLLDPSRPLASLGGVARVCFHPLTVATVLLASLFALIHALGSIDIGNIDWTQLRHPSLWLGAMISLAITKSLHEMGHALACRRFSVECHEMGVLWLFFLPCLYCDVSDSWRLSSRWQRMAIALAGIYIELMVALVAYVAWCLAAPGSFQSIMLLTAISASIGTVMINGNPLLRYDGYFVLSDCLGWPNLWQDASQAFRSLLAWCWGLSIRTGFSTMRFVALVAFSFASLLYRALLTVSLAWAALAVVPTRESPLLGSLLMAALIIPWLLTAIVSSQAIASGEPQSPPVRWLKRALTIGLMMGVVYSFVAIPFETRLACRAMCRQPAEPVFAPSSGQVVAITADGSTVDRNTLLVEIRDFKKEQLLRKLSLEVVALQATVLRLREQEATDSAIAQTLPAVQAVLDGKQEQLQLARTELERMQIRSSIAGTWCCRIAPANTDHSGPTGESEFSENARAFNEQLAMGSAVELGQLLGRVHSSAPLIVEAVLPEADLDLLDFSRPVHLRLDYSPAKDLLAEIVEVQPPERKRVDAEAKLTDQHSTSDRAGARKAWASSHLIVRMQLKEPTEILLPVNAGTALVPTRPMSAGQRCWRWIQTTFRLP